MTYGAKLKVRDGQEVLPGQELVEWDPFTNPMLTEVGGTSSSGISSRACQERVDAVTGKVSRLIIEAKDQDIRPRISVKDEPGQRPRSPVRWPTPGIPCRWGPSSWSTMGT